MRARHYKVQQYNDARFSSITGCTTCYVCTHVEAVQKQLEIFLFTCLQNLLVFSNQVQIIKSNIRLIQKTISKIIFKDDKIG